MLCHSASSLYDELIFIISPTQNFLSSFQFSLKMQMGTQAASLLSLKYQNVIRTK